MSLHSKVESSAILVQGVKHLDDEGRLAHGDVYYVDGLISYKEQDSSSTIDANGMWLVPSWTDLYAYYGEGETSYVETFDSGRKVALSSGFSSVCLAPLGNPPLAHADQLAYFRQLSDRAKDINLHFMASAYLDNGNMSGILELAEEGIDRFCITGKPVRSEEQLLHLMRYLGGADATLVTYPAYSEALLKSPLYNSPTSTKMGIRGAHVDLWLMELKALLDTAKLTDAKLHITGVALRAQLELIEEARRAGLQVTADIGIQHLVAEEEEVQTFDTHLKVTPPLGVEEDRAALRSYLLREEWLGLSSQHIPVHVDDKVLPFQEAKQGSNNQGILYPLLQRCYSEEDTHHIATEVLGKRNRKLLGLGEEPDAYVLLNPKTNWTFDEATNFSLSRNSRYVNQQMKGKVSYTLTKEGYYKWI